MMVKGIGVDILDVERFERIDDKQSFIRQILTEKERKEARDGGRDARFSAVLFAAKEAVMKALGCGLNFGSCWQDIEIEKLRKARLRGVVGQCAADASVSQIHISHSHSRKYVLTCVITED
jgi:holo-[acyl-carrier protein] synthase